MTGLESSESLCDRGSVMNQRRWSGVWVQVSTSVQGDVHRRLDGGVGTRSQWVRNLVSPNSCSSEPV